MSLSRPGTHNGYGNYCMDPSMYPHCAPYISGHYDANEVRRRQLMNHTGMNGPGFYPNNYQYHHYQGFPPPNMRSADGYMDRYAMGRAETMYSNGYGDPRRGGMMGGRRASGTELDRYMEDHPDPYGDVWDGRAGMSRYPGYPSQTMMRPMHRIHIPLKLQRNRYPRSRRDRRLFGGYGRTRGYPPPLRMFDGYEMEPGWEDYDGYDSEDLVPDMYERSVGRNEW
ncbi:hypothetical protein NA57DRAFT_72643 [Rhizodiscina lignyota]|uniref:Uncharacterized protein n=1 Tax=Rhizodiscina lignyota TaxID=1504668 RepID=A0A9P4M8M6_9PEZI|nr:hypothetical protein NA57DRAFT_72643 [Rhizodiscina lignyota]